jgi:hypothetical protein
MGKHESNHQPFTEKCGRRPKSQVINNSLQKGNTTFQPHAVDQKAIHLLGLHCIDCYAQRRLEFHPDQHKYCRWQGRGVQATANGIMGKYRLTYLHICGMGLAQLLFFSHYNFRHAHIAISCKRAKVFPRGVALLPYGLRIGTLIRYKKVSSRNIDWWASKTDAEVLIARGVSNSFLSTTTSALCPGIGGPGARLVGSHSLTNDVPVTHIFVRGSPGTYC